MIEPGAPVIDFSSALYLGMRHPSSALEPWDALTTGAPAALTEPKRAAQVASELAALVGSAAVTLGVSTLHLFFDFFGTRAATDGTIMFYDESVYPVAKWGVERAAGHGVSAQAYAHFSPASVASAIERASLRRLRPILVTDGYCPGCGRRAPLRAYQRLLQRAGGTMVIDDTQALGLCGGAPGTPTAGGGSNPRTQLGAERVIWIASLAKAFGAPLAAFAGESTTVARFERESELRVHASPPNAAAIGAAARAIAVNRSLGDELRRRLAQRVRHFRAGIAALGLSVTGGEHPVQLLDRIPGTTPLVLCETLARFGVQTVPVRAQCTGRSALAFVLTAKHELAQIERALRIVGATVRHLQKLSAMSRALGAVS